MRKWLGIKKGKDCTFCMKQTHKCTNQQLARLAIASIYIVMQSARISWLFWTSPKIAQTSWTFHKDPMLMVLHLKFKYRLRWCYLWSFSASILKQIFQYYDIFQNLLCSVCSSNCLQKRKTLFILVLLYIMWLCLKLRSVISFALSVSNQTVVS